LHDKLAGYTRLASVLTLAVLGWLLVSIKSDLASVVRSLAQLPQSVTVAHHQADMTTLKKCLCSPTLGLIEVVTTCEPNESPEDCADRHRRAIARWKDAVPDAVECDCP
jgi:hypothetical protein